MRVLKNGGAVAFPTDTVYGVGAVMSLSGRKKLLKIKKREASRPLGLFVSSIAQARKLTIDVSGDAAELMKQLWPGRLTLVFKASAAIPDKLQYKGTIGIRMPDQSWLLSVLKQLKKPLLQTSANLSGHPPLTSVSEIFVQLGRKVELIVDAGGVKTGKPSTVVDVSGSRPRILRLGSVSRQRVERILQKKVYVSR
ncbi:MAG: threonylcarbamoyl-AMP synthase [candidate division Zixibacteria bacterium]|nr:threonylcarbamoyl-AMP synthase [candidate division Zixibacteria bacterium]